MRAFRFDPWASLKTHADTPPPPKAPNPPNRSPEPAFEAAFQSAAGLGGAPNPPNRDGAEQGRLGALGGAPNPRALRKPAFEAGSDSGLGGLGGGHPPALNFASDRALAAALLAAAEHGAAAVAAAPADAEAADEEAAERAAIQAVDAGPNGEWTLADYRRRRERHLAALPALIRAGLLRPAELVRPEGHPLAGLPL